MLPDLVRPALRALGVVCFVLAAGCTDAGETPQYSVAIVPPSLELLQEVTVTLVRRPVLPIRSAILAG